MTLLKLRFNWIVSWSWNIPFEYRLLHRSSNLHIFSALTKWSTFFISFDKLSTQVISSNRCDVFIISYSKTFMSISKRSSPSDFCWGKFVKRITSNIKKILQYFSWRTEPLTFREREFMFWGRIVEWVCGKI